ncbi:hypothetical protein O987_08545 [Comamonas testosteroni TK102]|uniref:Uncharacterized protein n=1 Tax=Comamonas testosteroni TK102 TaxID=1392005 RepID=A0A076PQA2_COMTE|nr:MULTISPECIES: hypothetical protein [Comamonas]AIJ45855.1 hypothetical protein O987_08545 [Comamonas testosteroni TK102]MPS87154.1 hypothetical protein [Comamonas sp.]
MHKLLALSTAAVLTALLSACLVPERFSAAVDVQPDGSYSYRFDGTVVNALAVMKLRKQGVLSEKDHRELAEQAQQLSREPEVRKAVYNGNARYALEIAGQRKPGEGLRLLDLFTVQTDRNGVMTIAAKPLKDKEKRDFAQLGITMNGNLKVSLPGNAEVLSQNASSTPTLGLGSYSWKIGSLNVRPEIRLRFKP